mgnify:CR=1 FL=1
MGIPDGMRFVEVNCVRFPAYCHPYGIVKMAG